MLAPPYPSGGAASTSGQQRISYKETNASKSYTNAREIVDNFRRLNDSTLTSGWIRDRLSLTVTGGNPQIIRDAYSSLSANDKFTLNLYLWQKNLTNTVFPFSAAGHQRKRTYKRKNARVLTRKRRVA